MQVSISELKSNLGKYISIADKQDIYITKNGKRVAKMTSAQKNRVAAAKALFGILPCDADPDGSRLERLGD